MKYLLSVIIAFILGTSSAYAATLPTFSGGTGTSTQPTKGQVLVGQSNGTYAPQATSTLGITGGSGGSSLPTNPLQATSFTATSSANSIFPTLNKIQFVPADYATNGCAASSTATTFQGCVMAMILSATTTASSTAIVVSNDIPRSTFTSTLNTNVSGMNFPVSLVCVPGIKIGYSGQGAAINYNTGDPTGHITSEITGCLFQGQSALIAAGNTNTATTTGILFGSDKVGGIGGAVGVDLHDVSFNGFGRQVSIATNTYMLSLNHVNMSGGNGGGMLGDCLYAAPAANSGERTVINDITCTDPGNSTSTNDIYIANGGSASAFVSNISADDSQLFVGTSNGLFAIDKAHIENSASAIYAPYIPIMGTTSDMSTMISVNDLEIANDGVGATSFNTIIKHGGALSVNAVHLSNYNGGTVAAIVDHSLDNGVSSDHVCQVQIQGGSLTNIIAGSGGVAYDRATGGTCVDNTDNSYSIGLRAEANNTNQFFSGGTTVGTFDHSGNWTMLNSLTVPNASTTSFSAVTGSTTNNTVVNASTTNETVSGRFYDSLGLAGVLGSVPVATGSGFKWQATSTLGISGGGSTSACGANGQVQFATSSGSFGCTPLLTYSSSTQTLQANNFLVKAGNASIKLINTNDSSTKNGSWIVSYDGQQFCYDNGNGCNTRLYVGNIFNNTTVVGTGNSVAFPDATGFQTIEDDGSGDAAFTGTVEAGYTPTTALPVSPATIFAQGKSGSALPLIATASSTGSTTWQIDYRGHEVTGGKAPTVTGGTSAMVAPSNDIAGEIAVAGTALTSVTMTFAKPFVVAPSCQESDNVLAVGTDITSISTTTVVFGFGTGGVTTANLWYRCTGTQ